MNAFVLYLLLLKATVTSFSGLSSLPMIREDLVERRAVLTDRQLNQAVAVARMTPGPFGLFVVCVGYYAAGPAGAAAGFLAMVTPALIAVVLLRFAGRRAERAEARRAIRAVTASAAGLVMYAATPWARDALTSPFTVATALVSFGLLTLTRVDTVWVLAAAAMAGALAGKV